MADVDQALAHLTNDDPDRSITVLGRGRRIVDAGRLVGKPGDGHFVARAPIDLTGRRGTRVPELDPDTNFGADIAVRAPS